MAHRDMRDNLPHMSPPEDAHGSPRFAPNGKPRETVEPNGRSFDIDGYAVTYTAGVTWKFLLGFDPEGGLTMYHLRYVLPPSKAHPNGKTIPYLYRAYIPDFGTDYSAGNLGVRLWASISYSMYHVSCIISYNLGVRPWDL